MKRILPVVLSIFLLYGCKQTVNFGSKPAMIDKNISFEKGSIKFGEKITETRYVTVSDQVRKDNNDIAFYLHGFGMSEYEWISKGGFGSLFYDTLRTNPDLPSMTVVSISLGGIFVFIDGAPEPYNADLDKLLITEIIPYFKKKYAKSGNVYLIGHSLGGFNSLTVSLRHPDIIKGIAVISPYVAPISPFTPEFDKKGRELKMPGYQIKMLKNLLTSAYINEENWYRYNPFQLVETGKEFPFIAISDAKSDLPGFEWSIDNFADLLEKKGVSHVFCKSEGDHNTTCKLFFNEFLTRISNKH
jgi:pimeloyl-ACP methyl ester carboxylesterase